MLSFSETVRANSVRPDQFTLQEAATAGSTVVALSNGCTDTNCAQCAGPASTCVVCDTSYFLHENKCIAACPIAGFYEGKVRCAFLTMDSVVLGLAALGCGCCTVRVFRQLTSRQVHLRVVRVFR
jgi:hypothetical protein